MMVLLAWLELSRALCCALLFPTCLVSRVEAAAAGVTLSRSVIGLGSAATVWRTLAREASLPACALTCSLPASHHATI